MEKVYKQFMTVLESVEVKPIEALGNQFDPNFHNAVMHVEDENFGENIVAEARPWGLPARVVDEVLGKAAEDVRLASRLPPSVSRSRRPPRRARFGAVEGDGILDSYRQAAWLKGRIRLSSGASLRLVISRS